MTVRVRVDVSEIDIMTTRAEGAFYRFPEEVWEVLSDAAEAERSTHEYQNRTGNLEASTTVERVVATDDVVSFTFGAREDYASYVEAKGLSNVTEYWEESVEEIDVIVNHLGEYIAHG